MSQLTNTRSIDEEIELITSAKTSTQLSFPVARGVVKLFNYYFREKDSRGRTKRLPSSEKDKRWKAYKRKVYTDYKRIVKGKFESEAALVKRYSNPMSFLKYRLKRHIDLRVSDLSKPDQEYYRELGGVDDMDEMSRRQGNIDSIDKAAERGVKRRRLDESGNFVQVYNGNHKRNRNHNNNDNNNNNSNNNHLDGPISLSFASSPVIQSSLDYPPSVACQSMSQLPKMEQPTIDTALTQLNQELTELEQEQIAKKKALAGALALAKTKSCIQAYQTELLSKPELLGIFPTSSLQDQLTSGFELWLSQNKQKILARIESIDVFIQQICSLREIAGDWSAFLQKWKLMRIFHDDDFNEAWRFMVNELNIQEINPQQEDDEKAEAE